MLNRFLVYSLSRLVFFGILLSFPEVSRAEFFTGPARYSLGVATGLQWVRTDLTHDVSKDGLMLLGSVSAERKAGALGWFGGSLGIQRVSQTGRTALREQVLVVTNPTLDLFWHRSLIKPEIEIGGLARNMLGSGSHFDFAQTNSMQWLLSVGPQLRYRLALAAGAELVTSLGFLLDMTSPKHTVWQLPLQISYAFPMKQKLAGGEAEALAPQANETPEPAPAAPASN